MYDSALNTLDVRLSERNQDSLIATPSLVIQTRKEKRIKNEIKKIKTGSFSK